MPEGTAQILLGLVLLAAGLSAGLSAGLLLLRGLRRLCARFTAPPFTTRSLLNRSEQQLHALLCGELPAGYRLLCQVSYGEILACRSRARFRRINSKRADFVICDGDWQPVAVIEYQGSGHFGRDRAGARDARRRDREKRRAATEAGLHFLEVPARFDAAGVARLLAPLQGRGRG